MLSQSFRLPFFIIGVLASEISTKFTFSIDAEEGIRWVHIYMDCVEEDSPQPVVVFQKVENSTEEGVISIHKNLKTALLHINQQYIHFEGPPGPKFFKHCLKMSWLNTYDADALMAELQREKGR